LPEGITPTLGPDGTGVGHVFLYTLDAKKMDLGEQRALQDWYIKSALQTVSGVAEVASFGFEKQYQIVIDPVKLQFYNLSMIEVMKQVKAGNNDVGGRKFEMSDIAYIIRGLGYIKQRRHRKHRCIKYQRYSVSFILLNAFGLSSNIMSLTGIALPIGVIVDNGITSVICE